MHITSSIILLAPGIYILRYPAGGEGALSVTRAPGGDGDQGKLECLSTPGTDGTLLRSTADCIVMQVSGASAAMLVTALVEHAGVPLPALRIDQIGLDARPAAASGGAGMSLLGHVDRIGDVVVAQGQVLGDPAAGLRIEGFQVMWPDRPAGVDLRYSIGVEGMPPAAAVQTGTFCGTRGLPRRITHLQFALVGPQAHQFSLEGSAWFSGGFCVPLVCGEPVSGPSGLEHLTGLTLRALPAATAVAPAANPTPASSCARPA